MKRVETAEQAPSNNATWLSATALATALLFSGSSKAEPPATKPTDHGPFPGVVLPKAPDHKAQAEALAATPAAVLPGHLGLGEFSETFIKGAAAALGFLGFMNGIRGLSALYKGARERIKDKSEFIHDISLSEPVTTVYRVVKDKDGGSQRIDAVTVDTPNLKDIYGNAFVLGLFEAACHHCSTKAPFPLTHVDQLTPGFFGRMKNHLLYGKSYDSQHLLGELKVQLVEYFSATNNRRLPLLGNKRPLEVLLIPLCDVKPSGQKSLVLAAVPLPDLQKLCVDENVAHLVAQAPQQKERIEQLATAAKMFQANNSTTSTPFVSVRVYAR